MQKMDYKTIYGCTNSLCKVQIEEKLPKKISLRLRRNWCIQLAKNWKEKKNPKQNNNTHPQHKKDQAIDKGKQTSISQLLLVI